jgi:hypothetical protein
MLISISGAYTTRSFQSAGQCVVIDILPAKVYEYMAVGLSVVILDFPYI